MRKLVEFCGNPDNWRVEGSGECAEKMARKQKVTDNDLGGFLIPRCRTLRVTAGKTISKLAGAAEVDRATIAKKIERNHGVTEPLAYRVFNVLNEWHRGTLSPAQEITTDARRRQ